MLECIWECENLRRNIVRIKTSGGNQQGIDRESTGNQQGINRELTGNQLGINWESTRETASNRKGIKLTSTGQ